MDEVTPQDVRRLREAIGRLNELNRSFDEDGHWVTSDGTERYGQARTDAEREYHQAVDALKAKGITEEADLEHVVALQANPNFREPVSLGHVVIDDEYEMEMER